MDYGKEVEQKGRGEEKKVEVVILHDCVIVIDKISREVNSPKMKLDKQSGPEIISGKGSV